eukprot:GFUD01025058.1.p1 GENE.GFUD01025058.1~~GFUD01025058.1.p1  ORF type:complete len:286 (-),score=48.78 GFUD01025058.1:48-905(-)
MPVISWEHIKRGSSPIDWCEENYTFSPHIAEFVNTFSNLLFFLLPPLLIHLHQPYARHCGPGIHLIWTLLIVVGASSAYFHATLSLLGQLLDEIAILWVIMAGFALWFPREAFPPQWSQSPDGRRKFSYLCFVFTVLSTFLGFIQPIVNAFVLLALGVPTMCLLIHELKMENNIRVLSLGRRSIVLWVLAVICWVNDRVFCSWWASIGFPYLHGAWHILIFLASYTAVVLFAYFEVKNKLSGPVPILRYYPYNNFQLGVPYVLLDQGAGWEVNGNDVKWQKLHQT